MKLSIIIPTYNERNTIESLLNLIEEEKTLQKQIIIVDDNSNDGSSEIITNFKFKSEYTYIKHEKNCGKGACIKSAKKFITGDIVIIQDADLEYNPKEYKKLIQPIIKNLTKVVYGSRVLNKKRYTATNFYSLSRVFYNHMLTIISNFINNQKLTDAHTCYKIFTADIFRSLNLKEDGFSFCPEVTTKLSRLGIDILELPIEYFGRTYKEGKKIKMIDGVKALITLIKYRFYE
jgi:glycosyltransferase involved in cell wall biosynthesis